MTEPVSDDELLAGQIRYYDARAPIYEQLYFLRGNHAVDDATTSSTEPPAVLRADDGWMSVAPCEPSHEGAWLVGATR